MSTDTTPLKYLRNDELRSEILDAIGYQMAPDDIPFGERKQFLRTELDAIAEYVGASCLHQTNATVAADILETVGTEPDEHLGAVSRGRQHLLRSGLKAIHRYCSTHAASDRPGKCGQLRQAAREETLTEAVSKAPLSYYDVRAHVYGECDCGCPVEALSPSETVSERQCINWRQALASEAATQDELSESSGFDQRTVSKHTRGDCAHDIAVSPVPGRSL